MKRNLLHALLRIPFIRSIYLDAAVRRFVRDSQVTDSLDEAYAALDRYLSGFLTYSRIAIRLADHDAQTVSDVFISGHGVESWDADSQRPLLGTATAAVMRHRHYILIEDCDDPIAKSDFPFLGLRPATERLPSMLIVPVFRGELAVGSIMLRSSEPGAFTERDADLVQEAANLITPTLVQSIHTHKLEREVFEKTTFAELGRTIGSVETTDDAWPGLIETASQLLVFDRLVVAFVSEDGRQITDELVHGVPIPAWDAQPTRNVSDVAGASVLAERKARIVSQSEVDADFRQSLGDRMLHESGLKSAIYAPLISGDRIIGTMSIRAKSANAFGSSDLSIFERLAIQIAGPLEAIRSREIVLRAARETAIKDGLEARNRHLTELNEAKDRILTTVSHELRTPLTSILAFSGLISQSKTTVLSDRDRKHVEAVLRNGERLKDLINNLLELSRVEAEAVHLHLEPLDLQTVLDEVVDVLRPLVEARFQSITFDLPDQLPLITDAHRLDQIITNLLANAIKYSGDGTEISISASATGGVMSLSIKDQGPGIADSESEAIFDAFHRLDGYSTSENPGSGLGLAIARRLTTALGGTLALTESSAGGSTFTLTIPSEIAEAA